MDAILKLSEAMVVGEGNKPTTTAIRRKRAELIAMSQEELDSLYETYGIVLPSNEVKTSATTSSLDLAEIEEINYDSELVTIKVKFTYESREKNAPILVDSDGNKWICTPNCLSDNSLYKAAHLRGKRVDILTNRQEIPHGDASRGTIPMFARIAFVDGLGHIQERMEEYEMKAVAHRLAMKRVRNVPSDQDGDSW